MNEADFILGLVWRRTLRWSQGRLPVEFMNGLVYDDYRASGTARQSARFSFGSLSGIGSMNAPSWPRILALAIGYIFMLVGALSIFTIPVYASLGLLAVDAVIGLLSDRTKIPMTGSPGLSCSPEAFSFCACWPCSVRVALDIGSFLPDTSLRGLEVFMPFDESDI